MKRRRTIVYLLIFMLLCGYFYFFEVIKKEKKMAEERAAKKVFQVKASQIQSLEVFPGGKQHVLIEKKNDWRIVDPLQVEVDDGTLEGYLKTLESLEMERDVAANPNDIAPYGLREPPLRVRFQVGDQWKELLVGNKNPAGGGYYAKTGDKPDVFLIGTGNWSVLSRGFNDLRRRDLFTFRPDTVSAIQVVWQDGASLVVVQKDTGSGWKSPGYPESAIKDSKVQNVLEQIGWIKATGFLENDVRNLDSYGLDSPNVIVTLRLKDGNKVELRLGKKMDEKKDILAAYSSQLPSVTEVDGSILKILPKNVRNLEDRSILGFNAEEVKQVKWQLGESQGQVEQTAGDKWGSKEADGKVKPFDEPWRVRAVLWELQDAEYDRRVSSPQRLPAKPYASLEIAGNEMVESFSWEKLPEDESKTITLWLTENGNSRAVEVKAETLGKIEEKLLEVFPNQ